MRKLTLSLLLAIIMMLTNSLFAQSFISGKIIDSGNKLNLENASVMLLQAKDSILVDFVRTDADGQFKISKTDTMDYLLLVNYPKFGEFNHTIRKGTKDVNLGDVSLTGVEHLIEEVLVQGRVPVVIKGDTVEYDAGSFTVEKNAKVEDLLKVLPGITVDGDGKITAQGKTVEKVLVDGEEFFGDDPTLVTRNIRSDMVDKVQVYEKKSDAAERTGVDDGERIQTINVKLKEDAKNGMFGKVEGGAGTDEFYLGKIALNKFKGSQKIGAYGLFSNDGTVGLGWQDEEKFGVGDGNMEVTEDGGMMFSWNGDEFSYWNGRGRPHVINTGISFMDRWKEGKQKLNFNYKYGRIENDEWNSSISQQNLTDSYLNRTSSDSSHVENQRHRFNGRYDWDIDSLTNFTVKLSGTRGDRESIQNNGGTTSDRENLLNDNERSQNILSKNSNLTYDGAITRKFRRAGRSLSLRLAGNVSEDEGDGHLNSTTKFYVRGQLDSTALIDQRKEMNSKSNNLRTSVTYTEPITDKWRASVGYTYNNSKSHSINNSYNKNGKNEYNVLDEEYSNDFDFNTVRNEGDLSIFYKADKIDFNVTNNVRHDDLFQQNNYLNTNVSRDFVTYNPSLRFTYNFTKSQSLRFNYQHSNQLPSLSQIQPLRQNNDPLNFVVGNENLTPSRSDSYTLNYNKYNIMTNMYQFGYVNFRQEHNSIQQSVDVDPNTGVRNIFYDNIKDHVSNNVNMWIGMGSNVIKKHKIQGRYGLNATMNDFYNFLNGELNRNRNYNYGVSLGFQKSTTKNIDFNLDVNPGWQRLESSLQPEFNSAGFVVNSNFDFKVFLPGKVQLYGEGSYMYQAPTEIFNEKFDRFLFKPGVSKKFLKGENLAVDLYVNDVFNQNVGFQRSQAAGMISQNSYNTISRFYMVKLTWDFTSMKGAQE